MSFDGDRARRRGVKPSAAGFAGTASAFDAFLSPVTGVSRMVTPPQEARDSKGVTPDRVATFLP